MNGAAAKNLSRERAQFAYQDVVQWEENWRQRALTRARGLPMQTRTQGLTITLATLMREDQVHASRLADLIGQWLLETAPVRTLGEVTTSQSWSDARRLLDACMKAERAAYQAAQTEALALLEHVKLYADALYGAKDR